MMKDPSLTYRSFANKSEGNDGHFHSIYSYVIIRNKHKAEVLKLCQATYNFDTQISNKTILKTEINNKNNARGHNKNAVREKDFTKNHTTKQRSRPLTLLHLMMCPSLENRNYDLELSRRSLELQRFISP